MKYKFLCILSIVSVIFGCAKSPIKSSLNEYSRANHYTTATVFPIDREDNKFAECVQKKLKKYLQHIKFIPGEKFREALFPWFEPNTAPKEIEELSALLSKTFVKKRIESLGVELLIYVHGYTATYDEGIGGMECLIVYSAERVTNISTTVWDLKEIVRIGDTNISRQGPVHAGCLLIIPFIIPAFTESGACSETAKQIYNCLTSKVSQTGK